ncbi:MAG: LAGLIDADG family homing endonuclease [Ktedonobacteraceae bacterium]
MEQGIILMRTGKRQQEEIVLRYQNGESSEKLAREYGISGAAVRGLLERRGIARRNSVLAARRYICNHTFFASINSEEKAYWLGFIAADGYVDSNHLKVELSSVDRDHLVRLATSLDSSHPVIDQIQRKYPSSTLSIYSAELCADLLKQGITPRKTFTLQWPALSNAILRHFVRGYVDGDGCFTVSGKIRRNTCFSVTSNKSFLLDFQDFLMRSCAINQTKLYQRHKDSPIYTLVYCGKLQVRRIVDFLYHGATIYLPRKYDRAHHITQ